LFFALGDCHGETYFGFEKIAVCNDIEGSALKLGEALGYRESETAAFGGA